ncbi:type II toxin-antitoxin system RelE family toxin [Acinetobacter johnsonii]|jgi:mRNA interferase RelE/StbE|uniref:Type II toxin-antitoxin system RelE/ParE family toxin n=1 Tax=Acinetobacter terrae TaxID=2731247 RepID=A0A7Y2WBD0_9GAMM|nr:MULTISPECIES: type II toxin-antitoxin system RelE/ParE family toxin [Acinetobacter]NNH78306.1 type II toxin-antitoxin system RelE/ParE family toxin [Acinetobacter terrae]OTT39162.1 addiction module antitoxin [Acinetobacter baumannii]QJB50190.1 type II toxin-antitoxin system RelE/ParE family toxin [Acinetobacter sp. NEB149]HCG3359445.1 type II toxin-antitoxin system RelE/ParE family toxin [Acinetobacter baumannii]
MTYELEFAKAALKKFDKLNPQIAEQFIRKLEAILENPKIPKNKLRGSTDLYKVKLRSAGYRLVYQVIDDRIVVLVLDVDRRDTIYKNM